LENEAEGVNEEVREDEGLKVLEKEIEGVAEAVEEDELLDDLLEEIEGVAEADEEDEPLGDLLIEVEEETVLLNEGVRLELGLALGLSDGLISSS
jgi:hypothetical protein